MKIQEYFCVGQEKINNSRQLEIDIVKGVTIIIMLFSHSYGMLSYDPEAGPFVIILDEILAGYLGASVFMICMGIGFVYTRDLTPKSLAKRGLKLICCNLGLNFARYVIPILISVIAGRPLINVGWYNVFRPTPETRWLYTAAVFIANDILSFAGLTMLFFALFHKLKLSPGKIFLIGAAASVIGSVFCPVEFDSDVLPMVFGYLFPTATSTFSFIQFLIFPTFGYLLGTRLIRVRDKDLFYKRVLIVTSPVVVIYAFLNIAMGAYYPFSADNSEYCVSVIDALFSLALCMFWIALWYMVSGLSGKRFTLLNRFSRNITLMYSIHWVIVGFASTLMVMYSRYYKALPTELDASPKQLFPLWVSLVFAVCLIPLTDFLAVQWNKLKKKKNAAKVRPDR